MRRGIGFIAFLLVILSLFLSPVSHARVLDSSHMNVSEIGWETPHISFSRPSVHGPLSALFVVTVGGGRDIAELAQRYDVDFSAVILQRHDRFGFDSTYQQNWGGISTEDKTAEILSRLDENPEVLVISKFDYTKLPAAIRQRIESMVSGGMGLVLINPINPPLADMQEFPGQRQEILSGVPLEALIDIYPQEDLSGQALAEKAVQTYTLGSGRVAVIRWYDHQRLHESGLTPTSSYYGIVDRIFIHRANYYFSLIGKALDWAAGRSQLVEWYGLPVDGQVLPAAAWPAGGFAAGLNWHGNPGAEGIVHAVIRDTSGRVISRESVPLEMSAGMNYILLNLPLPPAGLSYLDVSLDTGGEISGWATASLNIERPEEIVEITTESNYYDRDESVIGRVELRSMVAEETQLVVRAIDTYGREYARYNQTLQAGESEAEFALPLAGTRSMASYIEAEITRGGDTLSREETYIYTSRPRDSEFLSMIWAGEGVMRGSLSGFRLLQRTREAGFNAIYHFSWEGNLHKGTLTDLMPIQIITRLMIHQPPQPGWMNLFSLHLEQNWGVTDPDHSLANPVIQEVLRDRLASQAGHSSGLKPWWYSIGTESIFRGDFGFSPYGLEYFSDFLKRRYGTIENLNRQYGNDYYAFEDVPRQRGTGSSIPALIDHQLGMEDEWAALHGFLGDEIRKIDPDARVGAESSVIGQSQPYNIFGNMERMLDSVEVWGPYAIYGYQMRSLASDDHMLSHWWGSYYTGPPHAGILWDLLIQDRINFQMWWLAFAGHATEGIFNENLTYRDYFKNLLPDLEEIDGGMGMLLSGADIISDRDIAVHYSRESFHASKSDEIPFSTDESAITLAGLNSHYYSPPGRKSRPYRFTNARLIAEGKLTNPMAKILFLPAAICLSEEEAQGMKDFVHGGGIIVADMMPGVFNQYGRRLSAGLLDDVFGATTAGTSSMREISGVSITGDLWGTPVSFQLESNVTDAAMRTTTGRALKERDDIPLMIVNNYGDGRAILFNFDLAGIPGPSVITELLDTIIVEVAGATEDYRLTNVDNHVVTTTGSSGGIRNTQNNVIASRRGDVTFVGVYLPSEEVDEAPTLSWDEPMHTYNVRTSEYLGKINTITFTPLPPTEYGASAQVHLLSLHNQPIGGITVEADSTAQRGRMLTLNIEADLGGADPKDRLLRVEVHDPEGNNLKHLRSFITLETSETVCEVPFAYNDMPGEWTIKVKDLATGINKDKTISLE